MSGDVIKSFLIGLGFDVDESSLAKFNKAISSATVKVTALYAAIQTAAAGIFYGISKMSEGFEEIGYQLRLVAPAINKMLILRNAMISAYRTAGIDLVKVVKQSILFNYSLAKTKYALEAIYKSVGAKFLPLLTKQMDIFRKQIFANMPKIQAQLTKFVNAVFFAFKATVQLGTTLWSILGRIWDFFVELHKATSGWSTVVLGLVAAWEFLNLAFLATPLGLVLTGLLAILALWDDFKVWKEGGKSLFNWKNALPTMELIQTALKSILVIVTNIAGIVNDFFHADESHLVKRLENIADAFKKISVAIDNLFKSFHIPVIDKLLEWRDKAEKSILGAGSSALNAITSPNASANLNSAIAPTPLLNNYNGGNSQKVNQETNIIIQGAGDANDTGKAVASQQDKVNFDLVRNMRGALV